MIKKWCWTEMSFSLLFFSPLAAPWLPKTESAAVTHCVALMLNLARTHDKWLTTKFVVWTKYGITHSFPNPAKNLSLANIPPELDFGWLSKNRRISAGAGAKIRYSPNANVCTVQRVGRRKLLTKLNVTAPCKQNVSSKCQTAASVKLELQTVSQRLFYTDTRVGNGKSSATHMR